MAHNIRKESTRWSRSGVPPREASPGSSLSGQAEDELRPLHVSARKPWQPALGTKEKDRLATQKKTEIKKNNTISYTSEENEHEVATRIYNTTRNYITSTSSWSAAQVSTKLSGGGVVLPKNAGGTLRRGATRVKS
ncbi:unnamed protein product, partial [Amoebophrya sp. A25]|eukprot:GSA25T00019691001.1